MISPLINHICRVKSIVRRGEQFSYFFVKNSFM